MLKSNFQKKPFTDFLQKNSYKEFCKKFNGKHMCRGFFIYETLSNVYDDAFL